MGIGAPPAVPERSPCLWAHIRIHSDWWRTLLRWHELCAAFLATAKSIESVFDLDGQFADRHANLGCKPAGHASLCRSSPICARSQQLRTCALGSRVCDIWQSRVCDIWQSRVCDIWQCGPVATTRRRRGTSTHPTAGDVCNGVSRRRTHGCRVNLAPGVGHLRQCWPRHAYLNICCSRTPSSRTARLLRHRSHDVVACIVCWWPLGSCPCTRRRCHARLCHPSGPPSPIDGRSRSQG